MNNLHLSDEAQADLDGIKSYIAKNLENPSAAISTVRNITKDIRRLREHSLIGASLSSIADVESDYRFLVTTAIFYLICGGMKRINIEQSGGIGYTIQQRR